MKKRFLKLIDFIAIVINEGLSYFVSEKLGYKIIEECKKCGKCCRYMYSLDTFGEKDFRIMQRIYPGYRRFKIVGQDEFGNLIFACRLVGDDGLCRDYEDRLPLCRKYPAKKIYFNGKLHEGCGFKVVPEVEFKEYLKISQ
ncbi:MAG: YkgJ family cysteine cluster protein [Candidatus Gastranaerophilales bacterium]|nr:YkgJ family cysteine cluster protein [Candidatus Gastranaerophilales bacterium]